MSKEELKQKSIMASPNSYMVDVFEKDRRASRRLAYIRMSLISFFAFSYLAFSLYLFMPSEKPKIQEHVAVIDIKGIIMSDKKASIAKLEPVFKRAFSKDEVKAVILRINSPGGSPVQSDLINEAIYAYKERYKKPVIAVAEDTLASGAYFIAVAADEIIVNPSSIVGSIGVISGSFGFNELLNNIGVERRVYTAGEAKNLGDPFLPENEDGIEVRKEILQSIHQEFINVVKKGRGEKLAQSNDLFTGKVWTGQKAVELGLADDLGTVRSVVHSKFDGLPTMEYKPTENILKKLFDDFSPSEFVGQVFGGLTGFNNEILLMPHDL